MLKKSDAPNTNALVLFQAIRPVILKYSGRDLTWLAKTKAENVWSIHMEQNPLVYYYIISVQYGFR